MKWNIETNKLKVNDDSVDEKKKKIVHSTERAVNLRGN